MEDVIDDRQLVERAAAILLERRLMARFFDRIEFADPAYDLLLTLYVENAHDRPMTPDRCAEAMRIPPTTARRWIDHLMLEEVIEYRGSAGPKDAPDGAPLWLTAEAEQRVRSFLTRSLRGQRGERERMVDVDRG